MYQQILVGETNCTHDSQSFHNRRVRTKTWVHQSCGHEYLKMIVTCVRGTDWLMTVWQFNNWVPVITHFLSKCPENQRFWPTKSILNPNQMPKSVIFFLKIVKILTCPDRLLFWLNQFYTSTLVKITKNSPHSTNTSSELQK
jgi:hypothetical protein